MIVMSGSGVSVPGCQLSNEELTESYNAYLEKFAGGGKPSCPTFIEEASGIKSRFVLDKQGVLDIERMRPAVVSRGIDSLSVQAELAVNAAKEALCMANKSAEDVDGIIVACSSFERCYPAISIEVQHHLGVSSGWAFDMNVACSSGAFAIHNAYNLIKSGSAKSILVICPELYTANINYKDRRSHFIFGDAASAVLVEDESVFSGSTSFTILDTRIKTSYSRNIYNNFGVLNRDNMTNESVEADKTFFNQDGKLVKKEVTAMVAQHIKRHLGDNHIDIADVKRLWLHQANIHMNNKIASLVNPAANDESYSPVVLDRYGNTGAAGVFIAFDQYSKDMADDDIGVLCAFGAGYGVGSVLLKKRCAG